MAFLLEYKQFDAALLGLLSQSMVAVSQLIKLRLLRKSTPRATKHTPLIYWTLNTALMI